MSDDVTCHQSEQRWHIAAEPTEEALRDHFAGLAMRALIQRATETDLGDADTIARITRTAYVYAECMLVARER